MSVHLTQSQWDYISRQKHGESSSLATGDSDASFTNSLVFVLGLEGRDAPDPSWGIWQTLLDAVVQSAQPRPSMTHVELVIPAAKTKESMHFATYIAEKAGWFQNNRSFYLGENAGLWRAVPVSCANAAQRVRAECKKHVGTEYSISRYLWAVPPLRAFSSILPDRPMSYAHCGTLTARVLKRALSEMAPEHPSGWYGPSTLFIELSSDEVQNKTHAFLKGTESMKSLTETEEETLALNTLLNGSDDEVQTLSDASCCSAIRLLAERSSDTNLDETARRIVQKQLATSLLRYSIVNRC